jgi:glycosyltransferase involved in cell wall biosynthesis
MGGNKDGVVNLIKIFSILGEKHDQLKLLLIGTASEPELMELKQLAEHLNARNIVFYGSVARDEMPPLLCGAKILVLARPSSLQSTGGFPTKLGEYLATGKPVVVTKVGDIPRYLEDGENAYLVEPDDNNAFAEKLNFVLTHYDDALKTAGKGKDLTDSIFNYKVQSRRIQDFLLKFNES